MCVRRTLTLQQQTTVVVGKQSAQARSNALGRRRQGSAPDGQDSQRPGAQARKPDRGTPGRMRPKMASGCLAAE